MTTIKEAAKVLLSVCDGALAKDGMGYNKPDSDFISNVLSRGYLTYKQEESIYKILLKYKKQLEGFDINYNNLTFENIPKSDTPNIPKLNILNIDGWDTVKIPFGKYKGKTFADVVKIDMGYINWMANNLDSGFIRECANKVISGEPIKAESSELKLFLKGDKIYIQSPFEYKDKIKEIAERKWNPDKKMWVVPLSILRDVIKRFPKAILDDELKIILKKDQKIAELSSKAKDENINIKFNDNLELLPFQSVGVKFIENVGGKALISDSMGLGKTIQVLAYLRLHPELRPALVVCPASLKLNWRNEATKWLESTESISIVNGNIEQDKSIYIINYDILAKHEIELINKQFKIIIGDESHYLKNPKAKRTSTMIKISKNIPNRILLTGTPILNRPKELWTQLNIIDSNQYDKFTNFAFRYCAPEKNDFGWNFNGASNTEELNERLKTIMVRRTKEQVLKELPDKRRQTIIVPLSNAKEYMKAQDDFIKYLKEIDIEAAKKAKNAEHLVRIEGLKQLSVIGKMQSIIEQINNFIESDKKLVIFAHHKVVIEQLMNEFKDIAVSLTGETSTENRQKAVEDFQNNPAIKLFIGNLQSAGVGITLTSASDVMFIEFPWTPSQLLQAEDRLHRIGQKNAVNVIYMTGEDTIDIDIIELLENKSKIIDAVIDGREQANLNILEDLINKYKK